MKKRKANPALTGYMYVSRNFKRGEISVVGLENYCVGGKVENECVKRRGCMHVWDNGCWVVVSMWR